MQLLQNVMSMIPGPFGLWPAPGDADASRWHRRLLRPRHDGVAASGPHPRLRPGHDTRLHPTRRFLHLRRRQHRQRHRQPAKRQPDGQLPTLRRRKRHLQYDGACFTGDTLLLTKDGYKRIDQFKVGDRLLSRSEFDVNGPVEEKSVEEVFIRVAPIWNLHVGAKIIRTTAEHPFYVYDKGWRTTAELQIGDLLSSHDGQWVPVEGVGNSGEVTTVYNLRISDYHTYFVSGASWAFSVWAHNNSYDVEAAKALLKDAKKNGFSPIQGSGGNGKVYLVDKARLTAGKPYVGSTKRDVGTGTKGKDRMMDKDHLAKTVNGKAPKAKLIAENLTPEQKLGVEGILVDIGRARLSNAQNSIDVNLPKNANRVSAGNTLITNWFKTR